MCKLLGDKCFSAKKRKTNKKRRIATDDNSPFRWYFFTKSFQSRMAKVLAKVELRICE